MLVKDSVFVKGKTYKTVEGLPATVLFVQPNIGRLYVVHNRYKLNEAVLIHNLHGVLLGPDDEEIREHFKDSTVALIVKYSLTRDFYS